MCRNFSGLNKLTVNAEISIWVVDHLLDELHGAKNITKLDLSSVY